MSINTISIRDDILQPCLISVGLYSKEAEQLLLGTAAVESAMGTYLKQVPDGPGLGLMQIEPDTHQDIYDNFLRYKLPLREKILNECNYAGMPPHYNLIYNLAYAILIARIKYLRSPALLPKVNDINGFAEYWKNYYNSSKGAGSEVNFINAYNKYVQPLYNR